jgi:hypothetical protein
MEHWPNWMPDPLPPQTPLWFWEHEPTGREYLVKLMVQLYKAGMIRTMWEKST